MGLSSVAAQAIAVVSDMRIEEAGDWSVEPYSIGRLPDLARLAFVLKLIIRSPIKLLRIGPDRARSVDLIERIEVAVRTPERKLLAGESCAE